MTDLFWYNLETTVNCQVEKSVKAILCDPPSANDLISRHGPRSHIFELSDVEHEVSPNGFVQFGNV